MPLSLHNTRCTTPCTDTITDVCDIASLTFRDTDTILSPNYNICTGVNVYGYIVDTL